MELFEDCWYGEYVGVIIDIADVVVGMYRVFMSIKYAYKIKMRKCTDTIAWICNVIQGV